MSYPPTDLLRMVKISKAALGSQRKTVAEGLSCVVNPAQSEWAGPILSACNKDGTHCFWAHYRRLIAASIKEA